MSYDPGTVSTTELLASIEELGYTPEIVPTPAPDPDLEPPGTVEIAALPADLGALFARARERDAPVLVELSAPG